MGTLVIFEFRHFYNLCQVSIPYMTLRFHTLSELFRVNV
jgi:hypothetical protein